MTFDTRRVHGAPFHLESETEFSFILIKKELIKKRQMLYISSRMMDDYGGDEREPER